jgi:pimeloyl-ACP methyl ester carboxylesterase
MVIEAIISVTDIVESMHQRINPVPTSKANVAAERSGGISGLVYNSIRSITALVGKSLDGPLALLSQQLGQATPSANSAALISALNGVLGDHLVKRQSPLAIAMGFRLKGREVDLTTLAQAVVQKRGRVLIMVHGLCMNDAQWRQGQHDHGEKLSSELDSAVVYLRYNSGQHISDNGAQFNQLLEALCQQISTLDNTLPLRLSIVAHSMGGLVARSALQQGQTLKHQWPQQCVNLVFLGTPHHGAPLEKAGNWVDLLLGFHPYSAPLRRLTQIRSAGITDLRHGNVLASDWQARDRFDFSRDKRSPLPLPAHVNCYTIATTMSGTASSLGDHVLGDGLVPLDSALGKHEDSRFTLHFAPQHQWQGRGINHMQLLSHPEVYTTLVQWLKTSP